MACAIDLSSWQLPPVFRWLAETAGMSEPELLKTFNCGIGMMLVVDSARADEITALLESMGESVSRIGTIVQGEGVIYKGRLL
jgi:phosphoribosylformylglycinamidine cyclo-ligase